MYQIYSSPYVPSSLESKTEGEVAPMPKHLEVIEFTGMNFFTFLISFLDPGNWQQISEFV
jgi:hypothetical protein